MRHAACLLGLVTLLLGAAGSARPDEVVLAGGSRIEGVVLEHGEDGVRLLLPPGVEVRFAAADVAEVVPEEGAPTAGRWLRHAEPARGRPGGLQVALVHLIHLESGRRVDLVSAVHIGDEAYYRDVQRILEASDVVLYEMVKPRETVPEALEQGPNPIRDLQRLLGRTLGLAFQLDRIAYGRPHFVHADLTVEEMAAEAGDAVGDLQQQALVAGLPLRMIEAVLRAVGGGEVPPAVRLALKGTLARLLGTMGDRVQSMLGARMSEALLDRRNEVVVARLADLPPAIRSVAVFYGAAHMADIERRLVEGSGYRRAGGRWLTAWAVGSP